MTRMREAWSLQVYFEASDMLWIVMVFCNACWFCGGTGEETWMWIGEM